MKDTEVVALYHQALSVTPEQPTDYAADMWCDILRDLDYGDARHALVQLLKRSTFVSPSDIHNYVAPSRAWYEL